MTKAFSSRHITYVASINLWLTPIHHSGDMAAENSIYLMPDKPYLAPTRHPSYRSDRVGSIITTTWSVVIAGAVQSDKPATGDASPQIIRPALAATWRADGSHLTNGGSSRRQQTLLRFPRFSQLCSAKRRCPHFPIRLPLPNPARWRSGGEVEWGREWRKGEKKRISYEWRCHNSMSGPFKRTTMGVEGCGWLARSLSLPGGERGITAPRASTAGLNEEQSWPAARPDSLSIDSRPGLLTPSAQISQICIYKGN